MSGKFPRRPPGRNSNKAPAGPSNLAAQVQQLQITERQPRLTEAQGKEKEEQRKKEAAERKAKLERWSAAEKDLAPFKAGESSNSGQIRSNFFKITFLKDAPALHKYKIQLDNINDREPVNAKLRRYLITGLLDANPPTTDCHWACDYFSRIVSTGKLYQDYDDDPQTGHLTPHERTPPANTTVPTLQSRVFYEGLVDVAELKRLVDVKTPASKTYHANEDLKALNIVSWKNMSWHKATWNGGCVGKKFYPDVPRLSADLKINGNLVFKAKTGFFSSVRPGIGSLLLNVNVTTSAFYPVDVSVHEWIKARYRSPIPPFSKLEELRGLKVNFIGDHGRSYRIEAVSGSDVSRQLVGDKGSNTVLKDVQSKFSGQSITNLDPKAACVNIGSKSDPLWRPADKIVFLDWQMVSGKLDGQLTAEMVSIASDNPDANLRKIMDYAVGPLGISASKNDGMSMQAFGFELEKRVVSISSRYLPQPTLAFKGSNIPLKQSSTWNLLPLVNVGAEFINARPYPSIGALNISLGDSAPGNLNDHVHAFLGNFVDSLKSYGLATKGYQFEPAVLKDDIDIARRRTNNSRALTDAYEQLGKHQLVVVLLPSDHAEVYSDIKWWSDCVEGICTVCVLPLAVRKGAGNVIVNKQQRPATNKAPDGKLLANLCLKVNFKLGGSSHNVQPWCGANPETMIVGADVTHSGKGKDPNAPSLAGVVASCSEHPSQYLASARLQTNNTEHIEDLAGMITERVVAYHRLRKRIPANIIFYRDGVSESQYGMVYLEELPQVEAGCKEAIRTLGLKDQCPRITMIVVGKRHHTRFFQSESTTGAAKLCNLKPGLIIDHSVISPDRFSFFLQSHESANANLHAKNPFKGHTARSAHYVVISDGIGFTPKKLQEITHNICFTGARATTSLSVCTPARYADRLCDRLRCYMRPVLDGVMPYNRTLDEYRACTTTWNTARQGQSNPWANEVNDVMFYL